MKYDYGPIPSRRLGVSLSIEQTKFNVSFGDKLDSN